MEVSGNANGKTLHLNFHGRIIDHLGIQMYQSPIAAVAEMISNAWDAEAEVVKVRLPDVLNDDAELIVADNGIGMTFDECQNRFLEVGLNRRGDDPASRSGTKQRPILGRKGIGKFAGFGIATVIRVDTVSRTNGERTVFELDANRLRGNEYVGTSQKPIDVLTYEAPDPLRAETEHGTKITLRNLVIANRPSPSVFARGMARRFLLKQRSDDFEISINGDPLPDSLGEERIQFVFPRDFGLVSEEVVEKFRHIPVDDQGWGTEELSDGHTIRWRFVFYEDTIGEEELRGISVFANGKLAQTPFDFNLVGGLSGQHGIEYLHGVVEADFIDELPTDFIAPERQRIDWDRKETRPLLVWGQERVKTLLRYWRDLRGQAKLDMLQQKLGPFKERLEKLNRHERQVVERALKSLASISKMNDSDYQNVATAVLTAWEGGRLHDLITDLSNQEDMNEEVFISLLMEAEVMTSLHAAEIVRTKLEITSDLRRRVESQERENKLRDFIAEHPWLISPDWQTFIKEMSLKNVFAAIAAEELEKNQDFEKRVDLVLSSGDTLIIMEFMRPGVKLDRDHLARFGFYIEAIEAYLNANTGGQFKRVQASYLVADSISNLAHILSTVSKMEQDRRFAMDWETLISKAESQWKEFFFALVERSGEDERVLKLGTDMGLISVQGPAAVAVIEPAAQPLPPA